MNDPVPHQGESERTPMPASQLTETTLPEQSVAATTPEVTPPGPSAEMAKATTPPAPSTPAPVPANTKTAPIVASGPGDNVPKTFKKATDVMVPAMPDRTPVEAPVSGAGWEQELERSAASTGVSASMMRKIAGRESGNNPNARASTSSAAGLFQIIDGTWNSLAARYPQLGLNRRMDPNQQARVAPYYMREIQQNLHRALGRAPDEAESYLGWFLGPQGSARALRFSPDTPVSEAVDAASIRANPGVFKNIRTVGELYAWSARKMAQSAPRAAYSQRQTMADQNARMGVQSDPASTGQRVPFTVADDRAREREAEDKAYSMVQAAQAVVEQDWLISNALKNNGKAVYDPGFSVTPDTLQDDRVKALPPSYLGYLSKAMSQQDFDWRLQQAQRDHEVETRLAATPYGLPLRIAVNMADPAGLALGLISPVGMAVKGGQAARLAGAAVDGALGGLAADLPAMMNKPDYQNEQALWAGLTGTAGYLLLNRHLYKGAEAEVDQATQAMTKVRRDLEGGAGLGSGSLGAASVAGYRDPVRNDIEGFFDLQTEKSGAAWMDRVRFDMARRKNSDNELVSSLTDALVQDTVGNRNKAKAVTVPVEAQARQMEQQAGIKWARAYETATEDYRKRNNISRYEWEFGGEEARFQTLGSRAVRSTDPFEEFDPAVAKMAQTWREIAEDWRTLARNPGSKRGETIRPIPGADDWSDDLNYLPRFTNWGRFNQLNGEFGNDLRKLFGEAIARKNPDLDGDLAYRLGGYYYDRLAKVEAGQELTVQKALSGSDVETLRRDLLDYGLDNDAVQAALYHLDEKAGETGGKALTSRQKRRTLMDENFSMVLNGRGGAREVAVAEVWEDNLHAIVNAYNKQMSGTVAFGQLRIQNPKWRPGDPEAERWIVDGIHSDGDWQKLLAKIRAHDIEVRQGDQLKTVEAEIKDLQFAYEMIRGVPNSVDRTRLGQAMRIAQNVNFVRLMSQAGFSSISEFGKMLGEFGYKAMFQAVPGFRDFMRDIKTGKLLRDEMEDWEYIFTSGTDHLRGTGITWQGRDVASQLNDGASRSNRLDTLEQWTKKASRYTSMVSLAPITTLQERWALKAALSKFRNAALDGGKLSEQRMRLIGLDAETQGKVLEEIKRHDKWVYGENGQKVRILGLESWEPQTRSSFEHAITTWVRRAVQQNDIGQMNALLGSPFARILFQFRNFSIGAWSKQTLSAMHTHQVEDLHGFAASMMFGAMAYAVQTRLNIAGLQGEDFDREMERRLSNEKIVAAAFQRAGASSLIPGAWDFGSPLLGLDPVFDTRSTQQPTQGLASNPTFGLIDSLHGGFHDFNKSLRPGEHLSSGEYGRLMRAMVPVANFPGVLQLLNLSSRAYPAH
jgi:Transglycosylase SLT domain